MWSSSQIKYSISLTHAQEAACSHATGAAVAVVVAVADADATEAVVASGKTSVVNPR